LVLRTYPIRVAGVQSGPLSHEISWEQLQLDCGSPVALHEYTTVTKKLRRVGRFDLALARSAVTVNRPSFIALNFLDHLDYRNHSQRRWSALQSASRDFVDELETKLGVPVRFCGTGPNLADTIDRAEAALDTSPRICEHMAFSI
jgi:adenylosuccinate synthase